MDFLSRIFRFLLWVIVLAWSFRLLRWIFDRVLGRGSVAGQQAVRGTPVDAKDPQRSGRRLVRDPVCGMHVAEVLAIPLREGSEVVHFCSVQCRDQYAGKRKLAANG